MWISRLFLIYCLKNNTEWFICLYNKKELLINKRGKIMYRIKKTFKGYPFAHRQHTHDGHCKLVHGHNWDFEICMSADHLDQNGFVYDFGKFGDLKKWFTEMFDHTCLINGDDPNLEVFELLRAQGLIDLRIVDSCSSEGIAKMIYDKITADLKTDENNHRNLQLNYVIVYEDYKNAAQYTGNN